jgi:hypothetical protein
MWSAPKSGAKSGDGESAMRNFALRRSSHILHVLRFGNSTLLADTPHFENCNAPSLTTRREPEFSVGNESRRPRVRRSACGALRKRIEIALHDEKRGKRGEKKSEAEIMSHLDVLSACARARLALSRCLATLW